MPRYQRSATPEVVDGLKKPNTKTFSGDKMFLLVDILNGSVDTIFESYFEERWRTRMKKKRTFISLFLNRFFFVYFCVV